MKYTLIKTTPYYVTKNEKLNRNLAKKYIETYSKNVLIESLEMEARENGKAELVTIGATLSLQA